MKMASPRLDESQQTAVISERARRSHTLRDSGQEAATNSAAFTANHDHTSATPTSRDDGLGHDTASADSPLTPHDSLNDLSEHMANQTDRFNRDAHAVQSEQHASSAEAEDGAEDDQEDVDADEDLEEVGHELDGVSVSDPEYDGESDHADVDDNSVGESDAAISMDEEGVGAVKLRPGEMVEDDENEDGDDRSDGSVAFDGQAGQSVYSDEEEAWGEAADNDFEYEAAPNDNCIFCKLDEDHDPSEEFEPYLACARCGANAHQQCARDENARTAGDSKEPITPTISITASLPVLDHLWWKCPDCAEGMPGASSVVSDDQSPAIDRKNVQADNADEEEVSPNTSPNTGRGPLSHDVKPEFHSLFSELVTDADSHEGSRLLKGRKRYSAEVDGNMRTIRKRRKDNPEDHDSPQHPEPSTGSTSDSLRPEYARALRSRSGKITVLEHTRRSLQVQLSVGPVALRRALGEPNTGRNKGRTSRTRSSHASKVKARSRADDDAAIGNSRAAPVSAAAAATTTSAFVQEQYIPTPFSQPQPFYSLYDKETDEMKGKPYGGILNEEEADTSRTLPTSDDRRRFDEAKQKAESQWRARIIAQLAEEEPPARPSKKNPEAASQIKYVEFGGWEIKTWYAAPYPEEYSRNKILYICEFCLKYMNSDYVASRHKLKCPAKHPPGDEIYRSGSVSVFEVDGRKNPVYCQNLCLLAKLFLGSKTLYYDVEPFLFYVLCEYDEFGYHFVGYFSKEKRASSLNNVSCILTLPIHQRKGYGNLLIDFSYMLTRVEGKTGSPEKPLSDMGLVSYRNYWRLVMCQWLLKNFETRDSKNDGISIRRISSETGLTPDDVVSALEGLRALARDPGSKLYVYRIDVKYYEEYVAKWEAKDYVKLDPDSLVWTPYVMGRNNNLNFDLAPALNALAPREEEQQHHLPPVTGLSGTGGQEDGDADPPTKPNGVGSNGLATRDTIVESTEKDEPIGSRGHSENAVTALFGKDKAEDDVQNTKEGKLTRMETKYKDVLFTRFEVFPAVNLRRNNDRSRQTVGRPPPAARTLSNGNVVRPKKRTSAVSSAATGKFSTPTSGGASVARKKGGTGRGPGRWPKGTKKSDYGNADSGPGFPPGWRQRQQEHERLVSKLRDNNEQQQCKQTTAVVDDNEEDGKGLFAARGDGFEGKSGDGGAKEKEGGDGYGAERGNETREEGTREAHEAHAANEEVRVVVGVTGITKTDDSRAEMGKGKALEREERMLFGPTSGLDGMVPMDVDVPDARAQVGV